MKLDIGSGPEPIEGYTGVDLYAAGDNIVNAPMNALPFEDESVEAIHSSHALEHISKHEVIPTLAEWYRVLAWGGILYIEVPDLVWVCKNWLLYKDNGWNLDALFGSQVNDGQYHKTGFTRQLMYGYLNAAGFVGREVISGTITSHNQECLVFQVTK